MAIRNVGTIGGNIVNASPAADTIPPLMVLDAILVLKSKEGERKINIDEFFVGPGKTKIKDNEILTEIIIPNCSGKASFLKMGRRKAETLSVVNTAVRVVVEDGYCKDARIVLGASAPVPLRCKGAEELIINKKITEDLINKAAEAATSEISPIDDQRSSAWYREKVVRVLVKRTLLDVCQ